jgi:iron(III) transport system permease protein
MATAYIVNRVDAGEYPLAIAYSSLLILFMLVVVLAIQIGIGERRIGRRQVQGNAPAPVSVGR